jgi:hypothetical protein
MHHACIKRLFFFFKEENKKYNIESRKNKLVKFMKFKFTFMLLIFFIVMSLN